MATDSRKSLISQVFFTNQKLVAASDTDLIKLHVSTEGSS